jgi:hypothetical protein
VSLRTSANKPISDQKIPETRLIFFAPFHPPFTEWCRRAAARFPFAALALYARTRTKWSSTLRDM